MGEWEVQLLNAIRLQSLDELPKQNKEWQGVLGVHEKDKPFQAVENGEIEQVILIKFSILKQDLVYFIIWNTFFMNTTIVDNSI